MYAQAAITFDDNVTNREGAGRKACMRRIMRALHSEHGTLQDAVRCFGDVAKRRDM